MSDFDEKLRRRVLGKRIAANIDDIRQAVAERVETDKVLNPQRKKLEDANNVIMAAVDDIVQVLTIWGVAQGRNLESSEMVAAAVESLADTAQIISLEDAMVDIDPVRILVTLNKAPEISARAAISKLDPEIRQSWLEWLTDE